MGKAKKHVKQKTGRPKINKHVDYVIYINHKDDKEFIDYCNKLYPNKVLKFINVSEMNTEYAQEYVTNNYKDINEWIQHSEVVVVYTDNNAPVDSFIMGICSVYNKPLRTIGDSVFDSQFYVPIGVDDPTDERGYRSAYTEYEIENKYLISEELYNKIINAETVNPISRTDLDIVQFLDYDDVRYREIITLGYDGKLDLDQEENPPQYIKEIKSTISDGEVSVKTETGANVSFRQYVNKFKEFKRWHDYERPIRKRRTCFSIFNDELGFIHFEVNKIKISTHTMYELEIESTIMSRLNEPTDIINKYTDRFKGDELLKQCAEALDVELSEGSYSRILPEDNITNKRIMNFIMEHKDQENYLKFIDFKNYCNSKCKNSVIKTKKYANV